MLHLQRRGLDTFGGLFLQSGSFFVPEHDWVESGFKRFRRIVRLVRDIARTENFEHAVPVVMTCGAEEENVHNNRDMARALAGQGYDVALHEVADTHNYTGWRDAFDPFLTDLLAGLWS
jgi:enterochelin esterase family protein